MAGLFPAIHALAANEGVDARHKAGMTAVCIAPPAKHHFGIVTATAIVHTSLLRLMISRLSFGPM